MTTPDERFFAWLDGELPVEEAARVEAEVAANPELQQLAEEHRAMQARLKAAFDPIAEAAVPDRLQDLVRTPDAEVVDFAAAKLSRGERRWGSLPQWAAMAATLAIGVFVGTAIPQRGGGPVEVKSADLYAASSLSHALETQLASEPAGDVRIGLTFRGQNGQICRTFQQPAASGLACRNGGQWQVRGLFASPEGQPTDYRMASSMDPNLAALMDVTIRGEPFDAAQERAAKEKGWR